MVIRLVLLFIFALLNLNNVACTTIIKQTNNAATITAPTWKAGNTVDVKVELPKGHAIALPYSINAIAKYGKQKCTNGVCPVLVTKALYYNGTTTRLIRFILFHNGHGDKTPSIVLNKYINNNNIPTMVYSCWMDAWPEKMEKYAPWEIMSIENTIVDYGLPTSTINNTKYYWYVLAPKKTL